MIKKSKKHHIMMTTAQRLERAFFLQLIREIDDVQGKIRLPKVTAKKAQCHYTK
jgi:hypothetical protein